MIRRTSFIKAAWIAAFFLWGALSARMVSFQVSSVCPKPTQLLAVPDVENPTLYGLISGVSLGAMPRNGFGAPDACIDVDAGKGVSQAQWPLMVKAAAKTWAFSRAAGFAFSGWVLWWACSWLLLAAQLLRSPKSSQAPMP